MKKGVEIMTEEKQTGEKIRNYLKSNNISKSELANKIGIPENKIRLKKNQLSAILQNLQSIECVVRLFF